MFICLYYIHVYEKDQGAVCGCVCLCVLVSTKAVRHVCVWKRGGTESLAPHQEDLSPGIIEIGCRMCEFGSDSQIVIVLVTLDSSTFDFYQDLKDAFLFSRFERWDMSSSVNGTNSRDFLYCSFLYAFCHHSWLEGLLVLHCPRQRVGS